MANNSQNTEWTKIPKNLIIPKEIPKILYDLRRSYSLSAKNTSMILWKSYLWSRGVSIWLFDGMEFTKKRHNVSFFIKMCRKTFKKQVSVSRSMRNHSIKLASLPFLKREKIRNWRSDSNLMFLIKKLMYILWSCPNFKSFFNIG